MFRTIIINHDRSGYSMIELVICMMVLGILVASAAPRILDSLDETKVDAAAHRMVADLKYARSRALLKADGSEGEVLIDAGADSYTLVGTPDPNKSDRDYTVVLGNTEYPANITMAVFSSGTGTSSTSFKYNMYGRITCGLFTRSILYAGSITLESGGHYKTIVFDPITGMPSIQ